MKHIKLSKGRGCVSSENETNWFGLQQRLSVQGVFFRTSVKSPVFLLLMSMTAFELCIKFLIVNTLLENNIHLTTTCL